MIQFHPIDFGTPEFDQAVRLRHITLRAPLGMEFDPEQLAQEYDTIHLAGFTMRGELVAYLNLVPLSDSLVKMRQVAVSPDLQGKGVGAQLVAYSEAYARMHGFSKIELNAREAVLEFYLKLKYSQVGERFVEVGIPHFKMEKVL
jgi:predicted GNAT family N-acyltransferase